MAEVTDHLGFAVTMSTSYTLPYQFARELSTLDRVTDGRIACNVVTSFLESAAGTSAELDPDRRIEHIGIEAIQGTINAFAGGESEWTVREMAQFAALGITSPVVVGTARGGSRRLSETHPARQ